MNLPELLKVARGEQPAEKVFVNGQVVNVLSGEVYSANVAVHAGLVVGLGDYQGWEVIDLQGRYLLPGLMDAHVHLESSLLDVPEFARAVVPHGTTAVIADPHELANVMGLAGVRYLLEAAEGLPLEVFVMVPSCVPASPFDDPGGTLTEEEIHTILQEEKVLGLAEMMNFPGAIGGDPEVLAKLEAAAGRPKDGHAPLVSGKELQAYLVAGPDSDHEATQLAEAQEKVRAGMYLFLREGSASHNLAALLPAVTPHNARRFCFACDDLQPADLLHAGHLDRILRKAVRLDLDPILAVQMATLNVAERFGLRRYGAIAPGYWADFALVENLNDFLVRQVYKRGQLVAENGEPRFEAPPPNNAHLRRTFHVAGLTLESFRLPWKGGNCRAIEVLPRQILTREVIVQPRTEGGYVVSDPTRDLLKAAVIERHRGTGLVGVGLVRGFGLKRGALASSVGHDSHNLTVVGVTDEDLWAAAQAVIEMNGGWAVVTWGEVVACLPLPIAGLMSDQPVGVVARQVGQLQEAAWTLGCTLPEPFMTLSFLSLAVIPELRLTPRGLVDVQKFALVEVGC